MARLVSEPEVSCPLIDHDDHRCARQFRLDRLRFAYRLCLSDFRACPIYHQIRREQAADVPVAPAIFGLTVRGRPVAPARAGAVAV